MKCIRKDLLIFVLVAIVSSVKCNETSDCASSENPTVCRGVNFVSKAFNQILSNQHDETLKLLPGLEIVQNENINNVNDERSMPEQSSETFLTRLGKYLQTHDLKIKFSDLVGKNDLQEVINNVFNNDDPAIVEARKKDKGGGYLLMSALMMGKMMAAMGLAGVGGLAMKALGVSMAALMLAGIVALKKVSAGGDHHRKRRGIDSEPNIGYGSAVPLAYRGYDRN